MRITRRSLLGLAGAAWMIPRRIAAEAPTRDHKFIFVFCPGGWDPAFVFAPNFGGTIYHFAGDEPASASGIAFTDNHLRPSVRSFFETWGSRTVLVNGIEVPSVAHDVCTKWVMTGDSLAAADDWVSLIAGHASPELLIPNVQVSGPLFPFRFPGASVRVGNAGQLSALLSGAALQSSDFPAPPLPDGAAVAQEALLRTRLTRWTDGRGGGLGSRLGAAESVALDRAHALAEFEGTLAGDTEDLQSALGIAAGCLEGGLSRTAMVGNGVGGNGAWDAHANCELQSPQFENLFAALASLAARLDSAPGSGGGSLLDETTVVVMSEMGRTPSVNASLGKDHWTWTSALLFGGGLQGGRTVGAWKDDLSGEPVDLATGEPSSRGETLLPGHLGATLLAIADIDPAEFVDPEVGSEIGGVLA
jgi:hypothetical protein